eukprot:8138064-Alexandrium_andersonii.AAC.1
MTTPTPFTPPCGYNRVSRVFRKHPLHEARHLALQTPTVASHWARAQTRAHTHTHRLEAHIN